MRNWALFLLVAACALTTACASSVQRRQDTMGYQYGGEKFSKVDLTVDPSACKDSEDLARFENKKLQETIERNLEASGLMDKAALSMVKVVITVHPV